MQLWQNAQRKCWNFALLLTYLIEKREVRTTIRTFFLCWNNYRVLFSGRFVPGFHETIAALSAFTLWPLPAQTSTSRNDSFSPALLQGFQLSTAGKKFSKRSFWLELFAAFCCWLFYRNISGTILDLVLVVQFIVLAVIDWDYLIVEIGFFRNGHSFTHLRILSFPIYGLIRGCLRLFYLSQKILPNSLGSGDLGSLG